MLGKAKQDLAGGKQPQKVLEGLGQSKGVSEQHQRALRDLLSDSGDAAGGSSSEHASAAEVLRSLVTGDSPGRKVAHRFLYGHVFRCLCRHLGEELAYDNWHDLRGSTWAKSLDKALKTAGVPAKTLSVSKHLVGRGSPFEQIPKYNDGPSIGYLQLVEVEAALGALRDARLDGLEAEERGFLTDMRGWLEKCSQMRRGLICFGG